MPSLGFGQLTRAVLGALPSLSRSIADEKRFTAADTIHTAILLDVSPSMNETDYRPNRFRAAQDSALEFVDERRHSGVPSKIALAGFGSIALPVLPLTSISEVRTIRAAIEALKSISGTNITAALAAAESFFNSADLVGAREILLLTDGGHNQGPSPLTVADRLKSTGCIIHIVGIGGSPAAVQENLLQILASSDANGDPLYRFIENRNGLVRHFRELGGLMR